MDKRLVRRQSSDFDAHKSEEIDDVHELETPNVVMAYNNKRNFDFSVRSSQINLGSGEDDDDVELL